MLDEGVEDDDLPFATFRARFQLGEAKSGLGHSIAFRYDMISYEMDGFGVPESAVGYGGFV